MKSVRSYLLVSLALVLSQQVFAQRLQLQDSLKIDGFEVQADRMGFIYSIRDDEIVKYQPNGDSMFVYSNKLLGHIDKLDVTLALRPLIFYQNTNQIIVTDNTLTAQIDQTIPLEQLDWQQVTAIASSFNNNKIWLYDQANFEILQVDRQLKIEQRSGNLLQVAGLDSLHVKELKEHQSKLYLNDPSTGIHVFDLFGTYYNTLHVKGVEQFEVYNNYIISRIGDSLSFYNRVTFSEMKVKLPLKNPKSIALKNDLIYMLKNGWVYRFKILANE